MNACAHVCSVLYSSVGAFEGVPLEPVISQESKMTISLAHSLKGRLLHCPPERARDRTSPQVPTYLDRGQKLYEEELIAVKWDSSLTQSCPEGSMRKPGAKAGTV